MKKNEKKLVYLPSNTEKEQMKMTKKDIDALSDKEIVDGLKGKDDRNTMAVFRHVTVMPCLWIPIIHQMHNTI